MASTLTISQPAFSDPLLTTLRLEARLARKQSAGPRACRLLEQVLQRYGDDARLSAEGAALIGDIERLLEDVR